MDRGREGGEMTSDSRPCLVHVSRIFLPSLGNISRSSNDFTLQPEIIAKLIPKT